jgi:hypothetical protein
MQTPIFVTNLGDESIIFISDVGKKYIFFLLSAEATRDIFGGGHIIFNLN